MASTNISNTTSRFHLALADLWRSLSKDMADTYRPELHYMRGPGPKWREKHLAAPATPTGVNVPQSYAPAH